MIGPRVSIGGWVDHLQMPTGPASCCNGRAYLAVQAHKIRYRRTLLSSDKLAGTKHLTKLEALKP
jgi:hypothetical protein